MSGVDKVRMWLQGAGLERFYVNFQKRNITESKFVDLIVSDYQSLGITDLKDRQLLFRLIQYVKRTSGQKSPLSSPTDRQNSRSVEQHHNSNDLHNRRKSAFVRLGRPKGHHDPYNVYATTTNVSKWAPVSKSGPTLERAKTSDSAHDPISVSTSSLGAMVMGENHRSWPEERNGNSRHERSRTPVQSGSRRNSVSRGSAQRRARSSDPDPKDVNTTRVEESNRTKRREKKKQPSKSRIMVCVRKRPLNSKEQARGDKDVVNVKTDQVLHIIEQRKRVDLTKYKQTHKFVFDAIFDTSFSNHEVYEQTCAPLVEFFFEKGKATCFAYGQTGSGKTYTMMGPDGGRQEQTGLYVLAAKDIFRYLEAYPRLSIYVSYFEIYGGKFYDLLNDRKRLQLQEDAHGAVHTVGLQENNCDTAQDLIEQILRGNGARKTGGTSVHNNSSRSHAVLQITSRNKRGKVHGSYSFIDLAGSERAADTQKSDRQRRIEGAEINKSLLALKECIRALDQKASHLPFRGSKLTQVLKDSFVGNCRTVMIATVAPGSNSVENSLNTLRYANRVKEMKEKKKKKSTINAYMPHASKSFAKADKPAPKIVDEESEDDEEFERRVARLAKTRTRAQSHASALYNTWGGQNSKQKPTQFMKNVMDARNSVSEEVSIRSNSDNLGSPPSRYKHGRSRSGIQGPTDISLSKTTPPSILKAAVEKAKISTSSPKKSQHKRSRSKIDDWPDEGIGHMGNSQENKNTNETESAEKMLERYQEICAQILDEEAQILEKHRKHIHETMMYVKDEMEVLKLFEGKRLSIDDYVEKLQVMGEKKAASAKGLSDLIKTFQEHLEEESKLNAKIEELEAQ